MFAQLLCSPCRLGPPSWAGGRQVSSVEVLLTSSSCLLLCLNAACPQLHVDSPLGAGRRGRASALGSGPQRPLRGVPDGGGVGVPQHCRLLRGGVPRRGHMDNGGGQVKARGAHRHLKGCFFASLPSPSIGGRSLPPDPKFPYFLPAVTVHSFARHGTPQHRLTA